MPFYLIKNRSGQYSPIDESDFEQSKGVGVGTVVKCTPPRNYRFLKKAFALMNLGYANQDKYKSLEIYRKTLTIRAGFYDEIEIVEGELIPQAQSLSFESMSAEKFDKWYNAVLDILAVDMDTMPEDIKREVEQFF